MKKKKKVVCTADLQKLVLHDFPKPTQTYLTI